MNEKQLFIVTTRGLGDFYAVAGSFDQAANLVYDELNAQTYGYSGEREVVAVKFVCRQRFSNGKRFFCGDDGKNHLLVWGDGDEGKKPEYSKLLEN